MTKKQLIGLVIAAAGATAILVVVHLLMPFHATWGINRLLHYAWTGVAVVGAVGGITFLLWPRHKARRKDEDRIRAQRKVYGLLIVVVLLVGLIILGEMHRENLSRTLLSEVALTDLDAIHKALADYAAAHKGARPATLADLCAASPDDASPPLAPEHLYYAYRDGPFKEAPPAADVAEKPEPSYVLVKIAPPTPDSPRKTDGGGTSAYLRSGSAWAPLTAVLTEDGRAYVTGDDAVRGYESLKK
jgi:hypothetical protein